jgi:hypothetical protein
VIQYRRHATAVELASLAAGALRPRKAARIESHLGGCEQCTQLSHQLDNVPITLASAHYPPMPESVSVRIEATLAVEARQRLAELPATEAGRGDLPGRRRRRVMRPDWHLPGLSVSATRLVAAAGALVVVAGGGYAIASEALGGHPAASSAGSSAAAPVQVEQMSLGPEVTYGGTSGRHTVHAVQSGADFVPASLSTQAVDAVRAAQARRVSAAQPTVGVPGASRAQSSTSAGTAAPGVTGRLSGCLNLIAAARTVLLVDIARFEHKPATLIVIAATAASPAEAWVVGSSCSATDRDVLGHALLSHLK